MADDLLAVTLTVTTALERCGVNYSVGGSLASSFSGEPRASIDADIVVDLASDQVTPLVAGLGEDFYADSDALLRAIETGTSSNLVHRPTGVKVDLFVASSLLDRQQLRRRHLVRVTSNPDGYLYIHSPEDILLQKLHWYRLGGGTSERQWRDALAIVLVQGNRLDRPYLDDLAAKLNLSALLERVLLEINGKRGV